VIDKTDIAEFNKRLKGTMDPPKKAQTKLPGRQATLSRGPLRIGTGSSGGREPGESRGPAADLGDSCAAP
jgi:hypothetical protein